MYEKNRRIAESLPLSPHFDLQHNFFVLSFTMDPFTVSMAVAPLVLSTTKLAMLISALRNSYESAPATLTATLTECKIIHTALSKIQELIYKNETDLSSRLKTQAPLREAFDGALTGCRMTLSALNLEMDTLVEPKKGTNSMEIGFQAKAPLVWKEGIMNQLLDQTRGQMSSLLHLIEILESETQADMLRILKENSVDIQKFLNRAKSIRSSQGIDDHRSSFHFGSQVAAYKMALSYEAQLAQSPAYQRAEKFVADELLTKKIELLSEKYALEEKLDGLQLEVNLRDGKIAELKIATSVKDEKIARLEIEIVSKDEKVAQLEKDSGLKDEKVTRLEQDTVFKNKKVASLKQDISWMREETTQLEQGIMMKDERIGILEKYVELKHDRIVILERDLLLKDRHLLSRKERITELESMIMQECDLVSLESDDVKAWLDKNRNARALHQQSKKEVNY